MSIQRYLEQLIEEIDEKMKIPSPAKIRKNDNRNLFFEQDEMDEFMLYRGIPVSQYSKILKESLPPPEKMDINQAGLLVDKISELLQGWNFHLEYPEATPVKEKYRLIHENWEKFEIPTSGWDFHQDFCSGSCDECEVKNYCETFKLYESADINPDAFDLPEPMELEPASERRSDSKSVKESPDKKDIISKILESIQKKDFIPSVHNYCDRWCDRCALTSKCSVFYFEKELLKIAANDYSGRSSFESVKHVYTLTHEILNENMKDCGFDLDLPFKTNDSFFPKIPAREQKVLDLAKEYAFSSSEVINSIPEKKIMGDFEMIEAINVIVYYHIFIPAKLARAFFGRVKYPEDDIFQNDSNGSAKIALIAMKKSLDSWTKMIKHKKDKEEDILNQCVKLRKLQKMVEKYFPDTGKFLRPGFDFIPD